MGVTILMFAGLPLLQPLSIPTIRGGDLREATTITPALVTAIRDADAPAVRKLIEDGADVNARDSEGNTPIILASFYASPKCVVLLLEKGADADAANKGGITALIRAATDFEKTRLLVAAGAKVRGPTADRGNTPPILAARRAGNPRTVKVLLERGADATERNKAGIGPIVSGAASGELQTVQFLLDAGTMADDFPKSNSGDIATGFRRPLMWVAYHNDVRMVRLLLDRGADPNRATYFGDPLSQACWNDGFEAAELLIHGGENVNARDAAADFTPLHWAAGNETCRPHLVKLLLASGADPNAVVGESVGALRLEPQAPRSFAEKCGRPAIVDALVTAGAGDQPRAEPIETPHRTLPEKLESSTLIASAEKALAALQTTAARLRESFLRHSSSQDCVACHRQYLPMATAGRARDRSIRFDREADREQVDLIVNSRNPFANREYVAEALFHPDQAHAFGYEMLGLAAEGVSPGAMTDKKVHHLVTVQASDGRWINNMPRPPMMSSDVTATESSIHAIQHYGWRGREEEFTARIEQACGWLRMVAAQTNEEMVSQLLGLYWAGEPIEKLTCRAQSLLREQRENGGWAQLPTLQSDSYATGQALYALSQLGNDRMADRSWQRGLRFLLERQEEDGTWHVSRRAFPFQPSMNSGLRFLLERQEDDGTWHVSRRAFPFQPSMNSGFPHYRDSWISAAATSWAVLALRRVTPVGSASDKFDIAQQSPPVRTSMDRWSVDFERQIKPLLER